MVNFHSYVQLPEGNDVTKQNNALMLMMWETLCELAPSILNWGWSTWNVTRKPYVTRCRVESSQGLGPFFWTCCWKKQLQSGPKHCTITSPRQCILMYFADTSISEITFYHPVMVEQWNWTRHSKKKMVDKWERLCSISFISTMPGKWPDWAAEESFHVSCVEYMCYHMFICCISKIMRMS